MGPPKYPLPRSSRLRKRIDYKAAQEEGRKFHTPHFIILLKENTTPESRLGITVTKKIGSATQRNRIKRLVREVFRQNRQLFPDNRDIVFIAKRGAGSLNYQAVKNEVIQVQKTMKSSRQGGRR